MKQKVRCCDKCRTTYINDRIATIHELQDMKYCSEKYEIIMESCGVCEKR